MPRPGARAYAAGDREVGRVDRQQCQTHAGARGPRAPRTLAGHAERGIHDTRLEQTHRRELRCLVRVARRAPDQHRSVGLSDQVARLREHGAETDDTFRTELRIFRGHGREPRHESQRVRALAEHEQMTGRIERSVRDAQRLARQRHDGRSVRTERRVAVVEISPRHELHPAWRGAFSEQAQSLVRASGDAPA